VKYATNTWPKEYKDRFLRYFDELKWLYCELYENRIDWQAERKKSELV